MNRKQNKCFLICMLFISVNLVYSVFLFPLWGYQDSIPVIQIATKNFKAGNYHNGTLLQINASISNVKNTRDPQFNHHNADDSIEYAANLDLSDEQSSTELFRIQFAEEGRCLGVSKAKDPVVKFCNPRENDAFVFKNGKLRSEQLSYCIGMDHMNTKLLAFMDCKEAVNMELINDYLVQKPDHESEVKLCLSALDNSEESDWKPTNRPELGDNVGLAECEETVSSVNLLEETSFLKDRAALLLPLPETLNETCNFTACGVNRHAPPVKTLPSDDIEICQNLTRCVTVVTKTARRPLFVIRLAKSLREQLNMDLPMIVIDDGPNDHSTEIMDEINRFPNLKYIIGESPDIGIAEGRTMGLRMVKTKYFLLLDDDMVASDQTNITKLVEILDTTDASLVGGGSDFAGFLRFDFFEGAPTLFHSPGSCKAAHQSIPGFPDCFRCEITTNIFVARTEDAIKAGGWSRELKIVEHKDFFLRLKAMGKKVVYCPAFNAKNKHGTVGVEFVGGSEVVYDTLEYSVLRLARKKIMTRKFCNHWNILHIITSGNRPAWLNDID